MAKEIARKGVDWAGRRLSRRGFVAMIGKIGPALGAAATGIGSLPERARAACACTPICDPAVFPCPVWPASHACPQGCTGITVTRCCDDGPGGTGTCHECHECNCGGVGNCFCFFNLGYVCTGTPC